ncbi:MAG: hypothetical protein K9G29_03480 [Crocinitomicaceae bacterium]|jgi:hypothetical protein|nr:hypothetical protein [Crocinitomicaceae bacterium]
MKLLIFFIGLFFVTSLNAQLSLSGGPSLLNPFGVKKSFYGLHIGGELPQNNQVTFFGRASYFFPRNEEDSLIAVAVGKDFNVSPYQVSVNYMNRTNYIMIEGGTRSYIGNGFDNGFSGYGGGKTMLMINNVGSKTARYNEAIYTLDENSLGKGTILSICLGLQGGLKYTLPTWGTIYADASLDYILFASPSNTNVQTSYFPNNRILFVTTIGFRKDFY